MNRPSMFLVVTFLGCLVGCSGSDTSDPGNGSTKGDGSETDKTDEPTKNDGDGKGSSTPSGTDGGSSGGDTKGDDTKSCPELAGDWHGTGEGETNEEAFHGKYKVAGSANVTLAAAQDGFSISDGLFDAVIRGTPLGDVKLPQKLTGSATCSELTMDGSGSLNDKPITSKLSCKFQGGTCAGEWTAFGFDGREIGKGTFTLSK